MSEEIKPVTKSDAMRLLRHAHDLLPRRRFWLIVVIGIGTGALIALPLGALLFFHEGPWTGFFWDLLFRLPFALIGLALMVEFARSFRARRWKDTAKALSGVLLFGALTTVIWLGFITQARGVLHFHRMWPGHLRSVSVACHSTSDPAPLEQIGNDLRGAQWYSPESHGWAPYASLTLVFDDGRAEHYSLAESLPEGRLVLLLGERWEGGLAAFPHLSIPMQQAGLLKVGIYPRYDHKGTYQAIVPASVCK